MKREAINLKIEHGRWVAIRGDASVIFGPVASVPVSVAWNKAVYWFHASPFLGHEYAAICQGGRGC